MSAIPKHAVVLAAALLAAGCVTVPTGPSVMVLPGSRKSFDEFRYDDQVCREYGFQSAGVTTQQAATDAGVASAAIGTGLGAAAGAAIGAATGDAGAGAAIGAGTGLLVGSAVGTDQAAYAGASAQERFDAGYMQCMYAKGNQIPVAGSAVESYTPQPPAPARAVRPSNIPPPPPGPPPAPPPDAG